MLKLFTKEILFFSRFCFMTEFLFGTYHKICFIGGNIGGNDFQSFNFLLNCQFGGWFFNRWQMIDALNISDY